MIKRIFIILGAIIGICALVFGGIFLYKKVTIKKITDSVSYNKAAQLYNDILDNNSEKLDASINAYLAEMDLPENISYAYNDPVLNKSTGVYEIKCSIKDSNIELLVTLDIENSQIATKTIYKDEPLVYYNGFDKSKVKSIVGQLYNDSIYVVNEVSDNGITMYSTANKNTIVFNEISKKKEGKWINLK